MSTPYGVNLKLLAAFRHLMVPLVRILLRNGIPYREFADVIKGVYAHVAAEENALPDRPASLARISIVTGLTRNDLSRLFIESERFNKALRSNADAIARLLKGWHSDPEYIGPYGVPRDLVFDANPAEAKTFSDLVGKYASGLSPGEMLEELLRVRTAILVTESKMIRVEKRTFIPEEMAPEQIEVFARGVRRYVETVDHNLREKDSSARRFERWVFPDFGIRETDWPIFRDMVHDRLQAVIQDLDTKFGGFERPESASKDVLKVGVGMYLYKDEADDELLFSRVVKSSKEFERDNKRRAPLGE